MKGAREEARKPAAYDGYYRRQTADPDMTLCAVGRGTPSGEYLRRFWWPVAYLSELDELPLKVAALVQERAERARYGERIAASVRTALQRARVRGVFFGMLTFSTFAGIVFVYMGPPERKPVFPMLDRFDIPGVKLVPGVRLPVDCNWVQIKENVVDPHHTNILHLIPQMRGMDHFSPSFGDYPEMTFMDTPAGGMYLAARQADGIIWVRSAEYFGPTMHCISSIFEEGSDPKDASPPFLTFWTLPVDDEHSINFFISHVSPDEPMSFEKRRELEVFGQTSDRPYRERQYIPGDHDAQSSQGPINPIALEHLGTHDRGVTLFRRFVRQGIKAVANGKDPKGFYLSQEDVPPTFANDKVIDAAAISSEGAPDLRKLAETVGREYLTRPPMQILREQP